jgi:hypothetical protein
VTVQRDIKKVEIPIFKSQISVSPENTIPIQFRIKTEDGTKISAWSNVYEIAGPAVISNNILTMINKIGATKKVLLSWDDESNANLYDIFVHRFQDITAPGEESGVFSKTATVATGTLFTEDDGTGAKKEHGLKVGMTITVSGLDSSYNVVGTTVTEVVDPYTFKYSPVGNTNTNGRTDGSFTIAAATTQLSTLSLNDYVYVDTTDRTFYNLSKSFTIKTENSNLSYNVTSTHMFARVQVASSNKKPNSLLTVGFANVATP